MFEINYQNAKQYQLSLQHEAQARRIARAAVSSQPSSVRQFSSQLGDGLIWIGRKIKSINLGQEPIVTELSRNCT